MVLVDIYVPSLDKTYDFQLDESASVENLIAEIAEMIGNETRSGGKLAAEKFFLCSMKQEKILQKKRTLQDYDIQNGCRLMLI